MTDAISTLDAVDQPATPLQFAFAIDKTDECERRITLTIPQSEVERHFSKEFDGLSSGGGHVPGFRPGKAPRHLIERRFRHEVADRVKSNLVVGALEGFSERKELVPIGEPRFQYDNVAIPETGDFSFSFDLEVRPDFDLPEWRGLTLNKLVHEFGDADVDKAIREVFAKNGIVRHKGDAPAAEGDFLDARFRFFENGECFTETELERVAVRQRLLFNDAIVPNFATLMAGVTAGEERDTEITIKPVGAEETAEGRTVTMKVCVADVFEPDVPEKIDNLAEREAVLRRFGFSSVEELRTSMKQVLERQMVYEQSRALRSQVIAALSPTTPWAIPPQLLRRQASRELRRIILEMQQSGYDDQAIQQQVNLIQQSLRQSVARALREHFILEKIAEMEGIDEVTEEELTGECVTIAEQQGISPRRLLKQLEQAGEFDIIRNQIIERKVIERVTAAANVTEKEVEVPNTAMRDEALEFAIAEPVMDGDDAIPTASEEDLRAVGRERAEAQRIDPNAKARQNSTTTSQRQPTTTSAASSVNAPRHSEST